MPLQTEYRPLSFQEVVGNKETIKAIKAMLKSEEMNHCILLSGDSGCGKTTLARLIAQELGAYDPDSSRNVDFREYNASDFKGIDMVRTVRADSAKVPLGGGNRVYFFDECHKLTGDAQEAFLKVLEEASGPNYYVFATTNPESLKTTLKRRCAQFSLQPISDDELFELLASVCDSSDIPASEEVLEAILQDSSGSPGVALGILDAIKGLSEKEMLAVAKQQAALQNEVIALCRALANGKTKWKEVAEILRGLQGQDPEAIRRKIVGYCSSWLLKKSDLRAFEIMDCFMTPTYNEGFPRIVHSCYMVIASSEK